jgi:hypothetical protein
LAGGSLAVVGSVSIRTPLRVSKLSNLYAPLDWASAGAADATAMILIQRNFFMLLTMSKKVFFTEKRKLFCAAGRARRGALSKGAGKTCQRKPKERFSSPQRRGRRIIARCLKGLQQVYTKAAFLVIFNDNKQLKAAPGLSKRGRREG